MELGILEYRLVDFVESGKYEFICKQGHSICAVLQQEKFEVLCEVACFALLDRYYREAITTFASALECFYKHALQVMFRHVAYDTALWSSCWREVANNSEKQLGAFTFVWANMFGEMPPSLTRKQVELRNRVVHRGMIPTREDAVSWGTKAIEIIRLLNDRLEDRFHDRKQTVMFEHLTRSRSGWNADVIVTTVFMPMITYDKNVSVEDYLLRIDGRRRSM